MWDDYDKLLAGIENWGKYYEKFFANQSINDEEECVEMCYLITGKEDVLLQNELKNVWRKIKDVIKSGRTPDHFKNYYCYFDRDISWACGRPYSY